MPYVEVRCSRVEAEFDAQLLSALEPSPQVILDMNLDRPLTQTLEELRAQSSARQGLTGLWLK